MVDEHPIGIEMLHPLVPEINLVLLMNSTMAQVTHEIISDIKLNFNNILWKFTHN